MDETFYSAEPELRRPRRFLRAAAADVRQARAGAWALFVAGLRARHRRAWLGYSWLVLPSLAAAGLCALIQARRVVLVGETDLPYPLFVLSGMILWQSFIDGLNAPLEQLQRSKALITRSTAPHEAVIGAGLLQSLLAATVRLAVLAGALAAFRFAPPVSAALLFPCGLLAVLLFGFAIGLWAAPFGLLYDDVSRLLLLASGFLFFLTPIVYPVPSSGVFRLNPLATLVDGSRGWLTGQSAPASFLPLVAVSLAGLALSWLFYRLARPHVVARLG